MWPISSTISMSRCAERSGCDRSAVGGAVERRGRPRVRTSRGRAATSVHPVARRVHAREWRGPAGCPTRLLSRRCAQCRAEQSRRRLPCPHRLGQCRRRLVERSGRPGPGHRHEPLRGALYQPAGFVLWHHGSRGSGAPSVSGRHHARHGAARGATHRHAAYPVGGPRHRRIARRDGGPGVRRHVSHVDAQCHRTRLARRASRCRRRVEPSPAAGHRARRRRWTRARAHDRDDDLSHLGGARRAVWAKPHRGWLVCRVAVSVAAWREAARAIRSSQLPHAARRHGLARRGTRSRRDPGRTPLRASAPDWCRHSGRPAVRPARCPSVDG